MFIYLFKRAKKKQPKKAKIFKKYSKNKKVINKKIKRRQPRMSMADVIDGMADIAIVVVGVVMVHVVIELLSYYFLKT